MARWNHTNVPFKVKALVLLLNLIGILIFLVCLQVFVPEAKGSEIGRSPFSRRQSITCYPRTMRP